MVKSFPITIIILLCIACSDPVTVVQVEEPPTSTIPLSSKITSIYCYTSLLQQNVTVYYLDLSLNPDPIIRNPSQDWINSYFKPKIENKQFFYSVSFPDDTVAIRLFIPFEDSTLIRQAFISESEIIKTIVSGSYSAGYLYPPNEELHISWNLTDSRGIRVPPNWYAFCTEFVEEDLAVIFWFKLAK